MKYLLFICLMVSPCFAEQITITMLPCSHIHIKNASTGEIIEVTTKDKIKQQVRKEDNFLFKQIKFFIKQYKFTNLADIKNMLETEDFILE